LTFENSCGFERRITGSVIALATKEHEKRPRATTSTERDVTHLDGHTSLDRLTELAYQELRTIAHRHLTAHGGDATLETTALVHEAYLKLANATPGAWRDQAHFRAVASVAMRHILVDRARARATQKHGAAFTPVSLDENTLATDDEPDTLLAIDSALDRLAELSPRLARVVELRFYGGLSERETANELGVTARTVQRDWAKARMLLERMLISL
jgi:RNA polymerase sigma factor (TIGR02999 family)